MEELLKNIQFQWKIHCFLGPTNKPQVGRKGSNAYDLPEDLEILEDESFDESEDDDDEWIGMNSHKKSLITIFWSQT